MNIDSIALVRATNILPYDGVVKTISNSPYLCKRNGTLFSFMISDLLKKNDVLPEIDYTKMDDDGYMDEYTKEAARIIKDYLPYTSDYNSMVLFSLNGLSPDDNEHGFANNMFSNKKCAIIEPLAKHIDSVVSLTPTDTAIKGNVVLSSESIILIEENYYNELPQDKKDHLAGMNIILFVGSLHDAVDKCLKESGRYIPEKLSLTRQNEGYVPSDTSDMQIQSIKQIAETYNIPQVLFYNILSKQNDDLDRLSIVDSEMDNAQLVEEYYLEKFLNYLADKLGSDDTFRSSNIIYDKNMMEQLSSNIEQYGIPKYKQLVDEYNKILNEKRNNGALETPQEIVEIKKERKAK